MAKCALLCFLIFISVSISKAQTVRVVKGRVIDYNSKRPLANATIEVYKDKKVILTAKADSLGAFSFSLDVYDKHTSFKISRLNYHSLDVYRNQQKLNASEMPNLGTFELSPKAIELKEVVIKRNQRYRDTTIIDLSNENFERSIMIDDLFSQKGLYKDSKGRLFYKGKPVSDVVVNGEDFFGKNNLTIYDKIPALTLNNIQIIETTIDSTTNTTLLNPILKVNLRLKEKYNNGKFGSIASGLGTTNRYIFNTDLYSYKKKTQISFATNLNNLDVNEVQMDPVINFSSNGNNTKKKNARFAYRSFLGKKLEINFSGKGKSESRFLLAEQERNDININQFTKSKNVSNSKTIKLEDLALNLRYIIDTLNSLQFNQSFNYNHIKNIDTINYYLQSNDLTTISDVNKQRKSNQSTFKSSLIYEKKSKTKKGRLFHVDLISEQVRHGANEQSNVIEKAMPYVLSGDRMAEEQKSTINSSFTEPYGEHGYIRFLTFFKKEVLRYSSLTFDSTGVGVSDYNRIINNYFYPGFLFQKTVNKYSFNGTVKGRLNSRLIDKPVSSSIRFINIDFDLKIDNRISETKNLSWSYMAVTNYPNAPQLTNINSTFDPVSQIYGNPNLAPEIKHSSAVSYDIKISDSLSIAVLGEASRYYSKFGYNLITEPNRSQISFIDNIGTSSSALINLSLSKTFQNIGNINFRIGCDYNESPSVINSRRTLTRGTTFTQSISSTRSLLKWLSISPTISSTYNKYIYDSGQQNLFTLIYTDKVSLNFFGIEINTSPIFNYSNKSINKSLIWAVNSEAKKFFLKGTGVVWVKAYDIFNSFQLQQNTFGSTYTSSANYSNVKRYFLFGCGIKFNNIK